MRHLTLLSTIMLCAASGPVLGQATLGEILDKGGKKLSRDEYVALLPATMSGPWEDGAGEWSVVYKPDGTFSGTARHYASGSTSPSYGTWEMDEKGRLCSNENLPAWNKTFKGCSYRYLLSGDLYVVPSDVDRDSKARLRAKGIQKKPE